MLDVRDLEDIFFVNLLYFIVFLIKVGFIFLIDIWNFIWFCDEEMEEIRIEKMKELEEKERVNCFGVVKNVLMMVGVLLDEGFFGQFINFFCCDVVLNKVDMEMKGVDFMEDKLKFFKFQD